MTLSRKHGTRVFRPSPRAYYGSYTVHRKKTSDKLNEPLLLKAHLHTYRHIRGTLDVYNHVPLFEVKEKLDQKSISNTEKHAYWNRRLYNEKSDRYHFAVISTFEQVVKLIENGYEFVTDMEGMKMLGKPK
jgi:hypothetical protein